LELLKKGLRAGSLEYMLFFFHKAYQMMILLYETVPAFRGFWIQCLGDLARFRMEIEKGNVFMGEFWRCSEACDLAPSDGRLYWRLAVLARPA
jgi:hypothetical protein